jgi:hypothetical protein
MGSAYGVGEALFATSQSKGFHLSWVMTYTTVFVLVALIPHSVEISDQV